MRKNIVARLFSVHNIIGLSGHRQVRLMRLHFKIYKNVVIGFPSAFCYFILLQSQFLTDLLHSSERDFKDRLDSTQWNALQLLQSVS